jgi:two-component system cell cycle sensor histidine kinase/response regulator CckA
MSRAPCVLVADDDPAVLALLATWLGQLGARALTAQGGAEAVGLFVRHRAEVDAVLLDVHMLGLDGPAALVLIRLLNPTLPCWFMTGDPAPYSTGSLLALGAVGVLIKPLSQADLAPLLAPPGRAP